MAGEQTTVLTKRVLLIGASIGIGWNFEDVGRRIQRPDYRFDFQGVYQFDKSETIRTAIDSNDKPAAVLIKECSVFFPGDLDQYKRQVTGWVEQLKAAGIRPVLLTTVPVARREGPFTRLKDGIKRMMGHPAKNDSLTSFNDWVSAYGQRADVPVFDIESFLRTGPGDRWLRSDYDVGDGVHLNDQAYGVMDREFARFLIAWK